MSVGGMWGIFVWELGYKILAVMSSASGRLSF